MQGLQGLQLLCVQQVVLLGATVASSRGPRCSRMLCVKQLFLCVLRMFTRMKVQLHTYASALP
jgi:hypothetical protein